MQMFCRFHSNDMDESKIMMWGEREGLQKGRRALLGGMEICIILMVVMAPQVYTYVRAYQNVPFKYVVYYISIIMQ